MVRRAGPGDRHYGWHRDRRPWFFVGRYRRRTGDAGDHRANRPRVRPPARGVPPWIGVPTAVVVAATTTVLYLESLRPDGADPAPPLPGVERLQPRTDRGPAGGSPQQRTGRPQPSRTQPTTNRAPDPPAGAPTPTGEPGSPSRGDEVGTQPEPAPSTSSCPALPPPLPTVLPEVKPNGKPARPKPSRGPPSRPARENETAP